MKVQIHHTQLGGDCPAPHRRQYLDISRRDGVLQTGLVHALYDGRVVLQLSPVVGEGRATPRAHQHLQGGLPDGAGTGRQRAPRPRARRH